jgi:choline dehydrogenase-like flavoprotein
MPGFGADFKKAVKQRYPALVALHPYGETLGRPENRITVDKANVDLYGVPRLKIDYQIGENERKMADEMYDRALDILHSAKAEIVPYEKGWLDSAGSAIHEHGTCRMGDDPKKSALNGFNQMHEVKNLFVVDGSSFTTASEKNPTLTILALSWRATDYLAEEMKRGNL